MKYLLTANLHDRQSSQATIEKVQSQANVSMEMTFDVTNLTEFHAYLMCFAKYAVGTLNVQKIHRDVFLFCRTIQKITEEVLLYNTIFLKGNTYVYVLHFPIKFKNGLPIKKKLGYVTLNKG